MAFFLLEKAVQRASLFYFKESKEIRQDHILYKKKNKDWYYVQLWDFDRCRYHSQRCTWQTKKGDARNWLREAMSNGEFGVAQKTKINFRTFAANFFCPGSQYIKHRQRESKRIPLWSNRFIFYRTWGERYRQKQLREIVGSVDCGSKKATMPLVVERKSPLCAYYTLLLCYNY